MIYTEELVASSDIANRYEAQSLILKNMPPWWYIFMPIGFLVYSGILKVLVPWLLEQDKPQAENNDKGDREVG